MTTTELDHETRFCEHLYSLKGGARADLRRSLLAERPSHYLPAFRYVEAFAPTRGVWQRDCYYLVAALFGAFEDEESQAPRIELPLVVRRYQAAAKEETEGMSGLEKRFLVLLDSDHDQLPYRLRQILAMVTSGSKRVRDRINWPGLLRDLKRWNDHSRHVQQRWARNFYSPEPENQGEKS